VRVYTLGTSTRGPEEFLNLLRAYGIQEVIDVRRFPSSRLKHFCRESLAALLEGAGITYLYLGEALGGYRPGGYEAYMARPEFREGIEAVLREAARRRCLILCAERFPWKCHRRFIGRALEGRGCRVEHIIDERRVWVR